MSRILLNKTYSAEELCDVGRDVDEAFDERFTPEAKGIPKDEQGFELGTYRVTVVWSPDDWKPFPALLLYARIHQWISRRRSKQ